MSLRKPADPAWIRIAARVYGAACVLLPREFRREYGDCLRQAFRDRCREVLRGERSAFRVLALELLPDLLIASGREHMHAGLDARSPRHVVLIGCFGLALAGLAFKDAITPPMLDVAVAARNRFDGFMELRRIEAREATARDTATQLAVDPDPASRALAASLYASIAERKQHPGDWLPDMQNKFGSHRAPDPAAEENQRIRQLAASVMEQREAGAYALVRIAESCHPDAGCDGDRVLSRLERVDSANAYAWALAFAAADARHDEPGKRDALSQLARSSRYDMYEGQTARRLIDTAKVMGLDEGAAAMLTPTAGLFGAHNLLAGYCTRHTRWAALDDATVTGPVQELKNDCRRAFELMSRSSTLGSSLTGWHGLLRFDDDLALRVDARAQLRDRYWLAGAVFFEHGGVYIDFPAEFHSSTNRLSWQQALDQGGGQIASLRRWFIARGLPDHAPADYFVPAEYVEARKD